MKHLVWRDSDRWRPQSDLVAAVAGRGRSGIVALPWRHLSTLDRIDVKLRHTFNPHLITKNAADNRSAGVING
jgi:hypothetical protein